MKRFIPLIDAGLLALETPLRPSLVSRPYRMGTKASPATRPPAVTNSRRTAGVLSAGACLPLSGGDALLFADSGGGGTSVCRD